MTSCGNTGNDNSCVAFSAIYTDKTDVLSDGTAKQILDHNLTGQELCNWQYADRA